MSCRTVAGVAATRVSPSALSATTPRRSAPSFDIILTFQARGSHSKYQGDRGRRFPSKRALNGARPRWLWTRARGSRPARYAISQHGSWHRELSRPRHSRMREVAAYANTVADLVSFAQW